MTEFFAITLLIILAAISPGPDFVMVTKNAISHSRAAGMFTSLGVACSLLMHASYCIMGLTIIISKSLLLFNMIKYAGAAYLIYIGIKGLLAKNEQTQVTKSNSHKTLSPLRAFRQGFLCNALNPKAVMFFLALFTIVVKPGTPLLVQSGYAIEIALIHLIWFAGLSLFLSHHKMTLLLRKAQTVITKIMGGVLILFGLRIATLAHQSIE
jgi:RhtB (resistance to homoserine/threonine) family protein